MKWNKFRPYSAPSVICQPSRVLPANDKNVDVVYLLEIGVLTVFHSFILRQEN